jgi:hypothetical protein
MSPPSSSDSGDESDESQSSSPTQQILSNSSRADDTQLHPIYYKPDREVQKHPNHHEDQEDTNPDSTTYPNSKTPINESIGEQKRNFKLPLTSLNKSSQSIDSPSSCFPQKITTQRGSSSNISEKKRKLDTEQKRKYIRLWLT